MIPTVMSYKVPPALCRPFRAKECVTVHDRDLATIGTAVVVYAGKRLVRTADGRKWRAADGWWVDSDGGAHPFPSIQHSMDQNDSASTRERRSPPDRVRKWCDCQMKCQEDDERTWTCTAHLDSGRAFQCCADPAKVTVTPEGWFRHTGGCTDFTPPGYNSNDPEAYGPVVKKPTRGKVKKQKAITGGCTNGNSQSSGTA